MSPSCPPFLHFFFFFFQKKKCSKIKCYLTVKLYNLFPYQLFPYLYSATKSASIKINKIDVELLDSGST